MSVSHFLKDNTALREDFGDSDKDIISEDDSKKALRSKMRSPSAVKLDKRSIDAQQQDQRRSRKREKVPGHLLFPYLSVIYEGITDQKFSARKL